MSWTNPTAKYLFHPSLEGAQHGDKTLAEYVKFCADIGCRGCQPSIYHLIKPDGTVMTPKEVQAVFDAQPLRPDIAAKFGAETMRFDGVSMHCITWVLQTAWTQSKTIRPFVPKDLRTASVADIEKWCLDIAVAGLETSVGLGRPIVAMFWGVAFGWEVATGYPWGFWAFSDDNDSDASYDLIAEGTERFVESSQELRTRAASLNAKWAHEIHPGTAAITAQCFNKIVAACDGDDTLCVNYDPSHCWEGEGWRDRLIRVVPDSKGGTRNVANHFKDHMSVPGLPVRNMEPDWQKRTMRFKPLGKGQIDLEEVGNELRVDGQPQAYCELSGTDTAPAMVEAECNFQDKDQTSADGVAWVNDNVCTPVSTGSFEDDMGD